MRPDYCPVANEPCQATCALSDVRCKIRDTAPPQRKWQELTDEEIRNEAKNHVFDESFFSGAVWARGQIMGKNHG